MIGSLLPIAAFRDQIMASVRKNPVTIITAETGAGKSTQVPQYLLAEGYNLVVTQPRRLAARTVAARVAEEIGEVLGSTVGYRTAVDRQDSPATRCLFCTDGLALVRELMGQNKGILVLDEVHEWNENMEVLVAWAKHQIETGVEFKVVLMSATLEAEKLAAFFNGAPVISVPGRLFPVEVKQPSARLIDDVATLVAQGRNVLVFQPGKREIEDVCAALKQMQVNAEILPLHGELTTEEQSRCFKHYDRPKVVVSTNVAQTSVTIDGINVVVDSGMERRVELVNGVEGLYLKPISRADATQRKGRAGRTSEGIYIDHCGTSARTDFPVAEIMRKRLDQTVLRLAIAGFNMEELEFFHQPAKSEIRDARRALIGLGCMTADGQVTKIGRLVNRLPVSVKYARMLVEAHRLGVVDDILTVAAILEQGGITVPTPSNNQPDRPDWRRMVPSETESDVIGQLTVWQMAESMTKDEMRDKGVSPQSFFRAKEIRYHLAQAVRQYFQLGSTGRREDILKAVCAGMADHLYKGSYGAYRNGDGTGRELGSSSLVRGADWLVGKPFDLQIKTRRGMMTLKLIELASKVDPMWLAEIAPQLVERKVGLNPRYDAQKDVVVSTTQTFFNGQLLPEEEIVDGEHPEAATIFARWLASQSSLSLAEDASISVRDLGAVLRANAERQERAQQLNIRSGERAFKVYSSDEITERFVAALSGVRCISGVIGSEALALPALDDDRVAPIIRDNPDTIHLLGNNLVVDYRPSYYGVMYSPQVRLPNDGGDWFNLPDEGIRLPGGRLVEIAVVFGYYNTISDTDIPLLKLKVQEYLNQDQWSQWVKPDIVTIDPADEKSEIPLVTAVYGRCKVTDRDLLAFGTLAINSSRWYASDPWFKASWFRNREEAEKVCAEALQKLEIIRADLRQKCELEAAKVEAKAYLEELQNLSSREGWYNLDYKLRREVENLRYSYLPRSIGELRENKAQTEALIAKVKAAFAELECEQGDALAVESIQSNPQPNTSFLEAGNRYFSCECGCKSRLTRSEWHLYQEGGIIAISCAACGASGSARKL